MAKIDKIKPGQTLYDVRRATGYAAFRYKYEYWPVYVKEVNKEEGYIVASWNGNAARIFRESSFSKFRYSPPKG